MLDKLDPLLAPLCRLLVARGITFADLAERLKGHYVRAALALIEDKQTDSRLSVMTGLQRREVARLRDFESKPAKPNALSLLVSRWQTEPGYTTEGKPAALPRSGPAPSFEALAFALRKDVHPRTMLENLLMTGTVRLSEDGQTVHLIETAYLPLGGSADQIDYLAHNVGDHLAGATENVLGATPPFFERAAHASDLSEEQVETLSRHFHSRQMALLEEINARAAQMKAENAATDGPRFRLRVGGYLYAKPLHARTTRGENE